jgi:predicted alpha-1,2-mannosidase
MFRRLSRNGRWQAAAMTALLLLTGSAAIVVSSAGPAKALVNLTQLVNPFIGTDDSNAPNPVGGGAGGSTYPGAAVPFGMVQFSPDTPTGSPSGYRFSDTSIQEFSMTHFDGAGCANNEDISILPITGAIGTSPGTGWTGYSSDFSKSTESAAPGYYRVNLARYNVLSELTATTRTGFAKFTFPATTSARVLVNTSRNATGTRNGSINIVGSSQVTGTFTGGGFCGGQTFSIFFAAQFDRSFSGFGTWLGATVSNGSRSASGSPSGGFLTFDTSTNQVVQMKMALSYVSIANAQQNLSTENPGSDFTAVRNAADGAWNTILNRVLVSGGSTADMTKLYTALYRVLQNPNIASDVNGQYLGFDNAVHTATFPVYQNYSGWDIYRSWIQLLAMLAPQETTDIVKSMVLDGQQGGTLPMWSHQNKEDHIMVGDPGPIIVSSAYAFGVRGFDTAAALALMNKSGTDPTANTQGRTARPGLSSYLSLHYSPGNAAVTLEYTQADFAVAQFARALGDSAKYNTFISRAQYWINNFNPVSSYVHYRNSDGSYPWPLSPTSGTGYIEGNAAQYTWMVPYNLSSVFRLMGGSSTATQRLDHLFTQVNGGLSQPYFYMGNEPQFATPWAYNYTGAAWKTQRAVRRTATEVFGTTPGGLPGNDDLGATSSWLVWAYLGLYPAIPGTDVLVLHGPMFPSTTIQLGGGHTLQINGTGAGPSAQYVQSLATNGTSTTKSWLNFSQLSAGATLQFTMGGSPNTSWGANSADRPPSFTDGFTPPAAPPALGTNLALSKPATGSAACATSESPDKAVDALLMNNSKWCSLATGTKSLQVDLGSSQTVSRFVIKHAGLGGETTGWNTGAFNIQTSTDGTNFTTVATVSGNQSSRTFHQITARTARFVRLNVTTPTNNGNTAARIYELEVYS